jgi:DNA-binding MarR family transcriptional regulator
MQVAGIQFKLIVSTAKYFRLQSGNSFVQYKIENSEKDPSDFTTQVEALDQVMLNLSWAARKQLAQELEEFNLTVPQYVTLRVLKQSGTGCTMKQLAEAAQQLSPTMTGIIDRLDEAGLVRRSADPNDRRSLQVFLTALGELTLNSIDERRKERLSQVMSCLDDQERATLLHLMQRYLSAVASFSSKAQHPLKTSGVE